MAWCKLCNQDIPGRQLFKHRWAEHREEARAQALGNIVAVAQREGSTTGDDGAGDGQGSPLRDEAGSETVEERPQAEKARTEKPQAAKPAEGKPPAVKPATSIGQANVLAISPRRFETSSILLWQAREAAIREWGWPEDITVEDFLDTYLHLSYLQRGIALGAYQVIRRGDGSG